MRNYIKNRFIYIFPFFLLSFLFIYFSSHNVFLSLYISIFIGLIIGNNYYYQGREKNSYVRSFFRTLKYFIVFFGSAIIIGLVTAVITNWE